MTSRLRETADALGALVALVLLVALPPLVLASTVGWPLPRELPTWSQVSDALSGASVSDAVLVKALACACWVVWMVLLLSIVEESVAWARGRAARRLPGAGLMQPMTRRLVMAATLLVGAARSTTPTVSLPPTAIAPAVVAVAPPAAPQPAVAEPVLPTCIVQPRDSLWKLAEQHLGDGMRWRELWELNRGQPQADGRVFADPNLIHPGWRLTMPSDAVGLDDPVPVLPPEAEAPALPPPSTTVPETTSVTPTTAASTGAENGHDAERPGAEPTSPEDADDPDSDVLPLLAGAALAAAGVITSLDRLRRRQLRHRPAGRSIRRPAPPTRLAEQRLRRAADVRSYSLLDLALRNLAAQLRHSDEADLPGIDVVSVGPVGVEILLDRTTEAPAGPFEVTADGRAWTLPATTDTAALAAVAHDHVGPAPALAAVGRVDDRTVLVDLESSPCTVVNGDPLDARALLWTIVLDLATSDRADDIELVVVGEVPAGMVPFDRVRHVDRLSSILEEVERQVHATDAVLDASSRGSAQTARLSGLGDGIAPLVVVVATQAEPESLDRLVALARRKAGVAVVVLGDVNAPDRELCVEEDTLVVKPLGLRLTPAALPPEISASATGLLADAGADDEIDLRDEVSVPPEEFDFTYDDEGAPIVPSGHVVLRVHGGVEIFGGARPIDRRRSTELVVYLALHPEGVNEEQIREALWPEDNPSRTAFNETVSRARRCLGLDPSDEPHVRHIKHGRYTLGPYVHLERTPGPLSQTSPTQLPLPFEGCRGYEWAYAEGFAYALDAGPDVVDRSA